ncbi:MAG: sulfotransferase domain-containing protein [Rhodospirillales bacterium]
MSSPKRIVLVTGCSRSGTTAVGSNLSLSRGTRYIYEPFNSQTGLTCINTHFPVPGSDEFSLELFDDCVRKIQVLDLDLKPGVLARDTGWRRIFKSHIGSRTRLSYLMCRFDMLLKTIVWKDPLAAFAAEALTIRHNIPVVVTVRPPVAVAASFKRMAWTPRVADLSRRLNDVGLNFAGSYIDRYQDSLHQSSVAAAILWRMVYSTLLHARRRSDALHFVNVQDFVEKPVARYHHLYDLLGLSWSPKVEAAIGKRHVAKSAKAKNAEQMPQRAHIAHRDLQQINQYGRKLLTPEEVKVIEDVCAELWPEVQAACLTWN